MYLVFVNHVEAKCPLRQAEPDDADHLAEVLEAADATGAFSMQQHFGVALVQATSADGLATAFALPKHEPAVVVDVTGDDGLQDIYRRATELDESTSLRYTLFDLAAPYVDGFDLTTVCKEQRPTNSLRRLPAYLREHAPGREA